MQDWVRFQIASRLVIFRLDLEMGSFGKFRLPERFDALKAARAASFSLTDSTR
jgi:hypothetical protein